MEAPLPEEITLDDHPPPPPSPAPRPEATWIVAGVLVLVLGFLAFLIVWLG